MLDFASLFGGGAAANGMTNPFGGLDSFADLGGSGLFGADIDVTTITDIDITTDITLIQNLVIDIDLGGRDEFTRDDAAFHDAVTEVRKALRAVDA